MSLERIENINIKVRLTKSFTDNPEHGTPAGVVVDANNLSDEQILKITQRLGFPESAFLQKSEVADFRLRLFSIRQEVNSCVTATLAAANLVMQERDSDKVTFETKIGLREISRTKEGILLMKQPEVKFLKEVNDYEKVASLLGIPIEAFDDLPMVVASAGTPKLLIPVKTLKDLFAIRPNLEAIAKYCEEIGARGFYPFTLETQNSDSDFHARAFNPQDGIAEDPVTGVAAAALAAYLKKYGIIDKDKLIGEQGYIMDKPGKIIIEYDSEDLYVGGKVVDVGEVEIKL